MPRTRVCLLQELCDCKTDSQAANTMMMLARFPRETDAAVGVTLHPFGWSPVLQCAA